MNTETLVRDGAAVWNPDRVIRYASPGERLGLLADKLDEEIAELKSANIGTDNFIEELADVVEVCFALGGYGAVMDMREHKLLTRGGYDKLVVFKRDVDG